MFRTYLWCDVPSKPVATFSGKKSHAPALVDSHSYTQQMASNEGKHLGEKRMIWRIIWGKYQGEWKERTQCQHANDCAYKPCVVFRIPLSGFVIIIATTIILKICTPLPLIHIIIKFIGNVFVGDRASSHALDCWIPDVSNELSFLVTSPSCFVKLCSKRLFDMYHESHKPWDPSIR